MAFPGHAGRCWPLARWRSLARIAAGHRLWAGSVSPVATIPAQIDRFDQRVYGLFVTRLAPEIVRQRLLIEGYYEVEIDEPRIESYLQGLAAHLGLRTYGRSAIFSPGGDGRTENQGFDAFVPLIDSGISIYVWTSSRFVALVLFTCKVFDEQAAIDYTCRTLSLGEYETRAF
jgi:S-adenosylmethionine/arginine decarboxylase-like enzyme